MSILCPPGTAVLGLVTVFVNDNPLLQKSDGKVMSVAAKSTLCVDQGGGSGGGAGAGAGAGVGAVLQLTPPEEHRDLLQQLKRVERATVELCSKGKLSGQLV